MRRKNEGTVLEETRWTYLRPKHFQLMRCNWKRSSQVEEADVRVWRRQEMEKRLLASEQFVGSDHNLTQVICPCLLRFDGPNNLMANNVLRCDDAIDSHRV